MCLRLVAKRQGPLPRPPRPPAPSSRRTWAAPCKRSSPSSTRGVAQAWARRAAYATKRATARRAAAQRQARASPSCSHPGRALGHHLGPPSQAGRQQANPASESRSPAGAPPGRGLRRGPRARLAAKRPV